TTGSVVRSTERRMRRSRSAPSVRRQWGELCRARLAGSHPPLPRLLVQPLENLVRGTHAAVTDPDARPGDQVVDLRGTCPTEGTGGARRGILGRAHVLSHAPASSSSGTARRNSYRSWR